MGRHRVSTQPIFNNLQGEARYIDEKTGKLYFNKYLKDHIQTLEQESKT
jgi:hypothetical protein